VSAEGAKRVPSPRNWVAEPKNVRKAEVSVSIPINRFYSCNNTSFTGVALTLHKSQLHCSGVIQEFSRTPEDIQGQDLFQG